MALGLALVARTTLRAPLVAGEASGSPGLLSSLPSLLWVLLALAVSGLAGVLLGLRGRERVATPFLASGLAFGIFVPGAFAVAPFLAAFGGRFLDFVLAASALLSIARLLAAGARPRFAVTANAVALASFVVYLLVGIKISRDVGLSGDEPHFVLVTYSILHDFDLQVQDNYGNEDYLHFYSGKIGPHLAVGTPYSVHGVGVPILLLPGFALGGLLGIVVTEALLGALLLRALFATALELTGDVGSSLFAIAAFGLTAPTLFLAVSAYPELPAALIVTVVGGRLVRTEAPSAGSALLLSLASGALPFFHIKFSPLAALLLLVLALRFRGHREALAGTILGAATALAALLAFWYATLGSIDPTASYGRQRMFVSGIPLGAAGLFFDQEYGLLACSPVYILGVCGLASLARVRPLLFALALAALLFVLLPGAAHPLWSGGNSPPARFLFPGLPLLVAGAACLLARERKLGVGPWATSLLSLSLAVSAAMLFLPGQPLYLNGRSGRGRVWEALSSSWDLTDYLPSLVRADPRSIAWAIGLGIVVVVAVLTQVRRRAVPLPPLAVPLLLGALVSDWTPSRRSSVLEGTWALGVMQELYERREERFLALPGGARLGAGEVAERMSLPLSLDPLDSDPAYWWSRSYPLPSGRFAATGAPPQAVSFCNGGSCFASGELTFSTQAFLERFQLRTTALLEPPRIRMIEPLPSGPRAVRTVPLGSDARLHGLDEGSYLDPAGFWIRKASSASFAIENRAEAQGIRVRNGGAGNRVEVRSGVWSETFELSPWEEREVMVPAASPLAVFTIRSESGFRPADLDPASRDRRELGVLLRVTPPFD
jgi:hypothetical protein